MIVRRPVRRGAAVVEMAVVAPLVVLFLFGLIVTGLGVFRYNQTAYLAREAARYASVRFPGKPLAKIRGVPMVEHVYRRCVESQAFIRICVATDDAHGQCLLQRSAERHQFSGRHSAGAVL